MQVDHLGIIRHCPSCGRANRERFEALGQRFRCAACKAPFSEIAEPVSVEDDAQFRKLIGFSSLPVLVDFWAGWCGPCKMMAPEFSRFAQTNAGKLLAVKVDTEQVPTLAAEFEVRALPTLVLFEKGKTVTRSEGAMSAAQMQQFLRSSG